MQDIKKIKRMVEALLFSSDSPLSEVRMSGIIGCPKNTISEVINILRTEYENDGRAFTIKRVNKGYKLFTLSEFSDIIMKLKGKRELYLSGAALTTLAVIVYKQPITRKEIEQIRGVDCSGVIHTLQEAELIRVTGKGDGFGHPYLYGTTDKFLEIFQIDSLMDLPEMIEKDGLFGAGGSDKIKEESSESD